MNNSDLSNLCAVCEKKYCELTDFDFSEKMSGLIVLQ